VARRHYENFPVASFFLPRDKRPLVAAVYAFARTADDFADEGSLTVTERLAKLDDWRARLEESYRGRAKHPIFIALAATAAKTGIPQQLFLDLLTAFRMDVVNRRFVRFDEVLEYCSFSAHPIGRMVLHIFNDANPRTFLLSDRICAGLQLANFWQDIATDWQKGRLYLPLEDLGRFDYTEDDLARGIVDERFRKLMAFQIGRARELLRGGRPLVKEAVKPLRFELALTVRGGLAILDAIEEAGFDTLHQRPALSVKDKAEIVAKAIADRLPWMTRRQR
jgi:squalene synthase HpnC